MSAAETIFSAKLAAKGIEPRNVKFQLALAEFQNNGGEYGVALAMLNAAYGKGSEGRPDHAQSGQGENADASRTDAAKGHNTCDELSDGRLPDAATERSAGPTRSAGAARVELPVAAPRNFPGHPRRGLAAISAVQQTVSKSLFDTTRLPDGRTLREISWSECPMLANRYRRLSRILMAIHGHAQPANPSDALDRIVSEDGLKEIIGTVERFNDIH